MRLSVVLCIVVAVLGLTSCANAVDQPKAADGVVDLSRWDFERGGVVTLDGGWLWYWKRLLSPADFAQAQTATGVYDVPSAWNGRTVDGAALSTDGFATFRLTIKVPGPGRYGVKLLFDKTAYRLWADDTLLIENGTVGETPETTRARSVGRFATFDTAGDTVHLTLQLSAAGYYLGGARDSVLFAPAAQMSQLVEARRIQAGFVIGALTIIGIYQFAMYFLRRADPAPLALGALCFCVAMWTGAQGETVLWELFPAVTWEMAARIELFAFFLSPMAAAGFLHLTQPQEFGRRSVLAYIVASGAAAAFALVTPLFIASQLIPFNQIVIFAFTTHAIAVVGLAWWRKNPDAPLMAAGIGISSALLLRDVILTMSGQTPTVYLATYGLLALIIVQSYMIARRFAQAYDTIDAQRTQLIRTNEAYYRFVPQAFLRLLGKDDITAVELGDGTQREMTVLFADIRDFTALSETLSPKENFAFVNNLLGTVGPVIRAHRGFIDKYMGDGIMALFPDEAGDALNAAAALYETLNRLNALRALKGEPAIRIGVGIHAGNLMLGTVGERERMDGTVIADAVNTASRLEQLTKQFGAQCIVSDAVAGAASENLRPLGSIRPKGKQQPIAIFEFLLADGAQAQQLKRETRATFAEGLGLFQTGRFHEAATRFADILAANPTDAPAAYYASRCAHYEQLGAPAAWDGVEVFEHK